MESITWAVIGGWALTVIGFIITRLRDSKKEVKQSASETQAIMTDLGYLKSGLGKIESKIDVMSTYTQNKLDDHEKRLTRIETKWELKNG